MARLFSDYITDRFYNDIISAIQNCIDDNRGNLDLWVNNIHKIGEVEVTDFHIKKMWIDDLPEMEVGIEMAVEADLEVKEADYHYDNYEECSKWFLLKCTGNLNCGLNDFIILSTDIYREKAEPKRPMSNSLVPIISKDKLDDIASEILMRYYPEALKTPMAVEPQVLAERMGLNIIIRPLTEDSSVFGQIVFCDTILDTYNVDVGKVEKTEISGKTIMVDPANFFLRNLGSVNNTIIHECVHWEKHRKAFKLERLYNKDATFIRCQTVGGVKDNKVRSATDWMEWQANALAPRLQMPIIPFKEKTREFIQRCRQEVGNVAIVDVLEWVIDSLATFFVVSREAAKIRLYDIGYDEVLGVFNYVDGRYVRPHSFKKGSLKPNQTFSISQNDAVAESALNPELRDKLASGEYLFVDSHFCLNSDKYIQRNDIGELELTDYARHNMEKCCLVFDLVVKSVNKYGEQFFTECVLYRDAASNIVFEAHYTSTDENINVDDEIKKYNADILKIAKSLPATFSGTLNKLIEWSEMTEEELAEAAEISEKTIQRLRNDEPDNVTLETVVQLIIGLSLPPALSDCLLRASRKDFMMTEQHMMYRMLVLTCYPKTIYECNERLLAQGLKPLGRQNRAKS